MPSPVDLTPLPTNSLSSVFTINSTDDAIQRRALFTLAAFKTQYPSRVFVFDAWHSVQSKLRGGPATANWIRVAERIEVGFAEKHDRWYQDKMGILHEKVIDCVIPFGLNLTAEDRLVQAVNNRNYLVIDVVKQSGVEHAMLQLDIEKFSYPNQTRGTYRLLRASARTG